ncbi:CLUMA_CG012012, isoform A [Clunio marinus]|uniref:CLUMA_CG012012, isoform A n=1 Tax=Clunio marinus TaxID=568069 RepID=A0A1J1IJ39_9DIPT|nr:CLUMA_CG012012, isoform A [Clunio marinus]
MIHEEISASNWCKELEDIFKGSVFGQFIASCVISCMTLLLIASSTSSPLKVINQSTYLVTMMTQLSLFCWSGNELTHSSHQLTQKAFCSNFIHFDKKTSQILLIFMQRTIRDVAIKAGGLFAVQLSLPTFVAIMRSSYSYFAVLNSVQNKEN